MPGISVDLVSNMEIVNSMVSRKMHNQDDSYLCWIFAFATSISNSVRLLLLGLHKKYKISTSQKKRCLAKMNDPEFHRRLRNEIGMVIPTSNVAGPEQSIKIRPAMVRVSTRMFKNLYFNFYLDGFQNNSLQRGCFHACLDS